MRIVEEKSIKKEYKKKNKMITEEKHDKREALIAEFNKRIGEKTRENEKKAAKSVEYAKHAIAH